MDALGSAGDGAVRPFLSRGRRRGGAGCVDSSGADPVERKTPGAILSGSKKDEVFPDLFWLFPLSLIRFFLHGSISHSLGDGSSAADYRRYSHGVACWRGNLPLACAQTPLSNRRNNDDGCAADAAAIKEPAYRRGLKNDRLFFYSCACMNSRRRFSFVHCLNRMVSCSQAEFQASSRQAGSSRYALRQVSC